MANMNRRTILVVDDEDYVANLDEAILLRGGFDVMIARTGQSALALLRDNPGRFALILLDFRLPDFNGVELSGLIRAADPGVKIVVSSGYFGDDIVSRFDYDIAFLQKPYTADRLINAVESTLNKAA